MKIAVVGATGMVGTIMMKLLEERNFPVSELIPVASERSVGKVVTFKGKEYKIVGLEKAVELKPDIAIFSAGGETSLIWAPKFAEVDCVVIDNSSAWRMDPTKKLVVPEINANVITSEDKIIAKEMPQEELQKLRKKIIILGEVTVGLSIIILFLASVLNAGGQL